MGLTVSIALGTEKAVDTLVPKPPAIPDVPAPPKQTDEQKRKAESEAVARQRAQAAAAGGGNANILTGPLGLIGNPALTKPTVLGG